MLKRYYIYFIIGIAVMDDNSNSPRGDDCGDGEEEEDREQATDEKSSTSSQFSIEGSSCTHLPR